ncbi:beta/gamma crystallin domain-containing protein [Massilia sp. CCM 9210]|uniref:beta/gamma crystallin domain-containing protein n=1 Tax=Massilia scottii TaxID=3057166 RepID=UPI0027969C1F|nr:beta/gamma crystallin domain-containing protein [Massilia sp. CCM 9210]MDQ1815651.1 beta/gamma crystallin domain-containing protein [Massilia sp. CCM 9210]
MELPDTAFTFISEDIMYAKHICRFTMLAMLAAVPALGMADGMVGTGQAGDTGKQTGATAQGGTAGATGQGQKGAAAGRASVPATVFMLVPVDVAPRENAMKSGCWARVYSGTDYSGDTLTLTGPVSIADMSGPFGLNWDDRVDSVELGPKATMTVFDNEQFRDQVAQFKPGQKVPDISRKLGFFDEFASVRLSCSKT